MYIHAHENGRVLYIIQTCNRKMHKKELFQYHYDDRLSLLFLHGVIFIKHTCKLNNYNTTKAIIMFLFYPLYVSLKT